MYEDTSLLSGVKSVVLGVIITLTPLLIKNTLLPNIVEKTNEGTSILEMDSMLNIFCIVLTIMGIVIIISGMFRIVTSFASGSYGEYESSDSCDTIDEISEEMEESSEDYKKLVSIDEMLLNYRKEYLENANQQIEEAVSKLIELEKKENNIENDTTYKKIRPKNETQSQMVKCSFCGKQKEMGGICKRCKTC